MPQMAPMWWTSIMMLTLTMMMIMIIIIYFNSTNKIYKNTTKMKKEINWKW